MLIDIPTLPEDGANFEGEEGPEAMELDPGGEVCPEGGLRYRLFAQVVTQGLVVRGRVEAGFRLVCSRCACSFSTAVSDSAFLRDYPLAEGQVQVDLTADLREAILLQLPSCPLCRPDCAGLCPRCGKDWNQGRCDCCPPSIPGKWSALDGLKL